MVHARRGGSHFSPQKRLRRPTSKAAQQMAHSLTSAGALKTWTRDTNAATRAQAEVHTGTVALATDSQKAGTLRWARTWRMDTGEPEESTGTAKSIFFWFPNSISRPPLLPAARTHARTHERTRAVTPEGGSTCAPRDSRDQRGDTHPNSTDSEIDSAM